MVCLFLPARCCRPSPLPQSRRPTPGPTGRVSPGEQACGRRREERLARGHFGRSPDERGPTRRWSPTGPAFVADNAGLVRIAATPTLIYRRAAA